MKSHPGQLSFDFTIPAEESLTIPQISRALRISTSKLYAEIDAGRLVAVTVGDIDADRDEWRVPLHNYIAWLNNEYSDELVYRFPAREWLMVPRVARFLNLSEPTIHKHILKGEFPNAVNEGTAHKKHWRIPLIDLVAFVNRRRAGAIC